MKRNIGLIIVFAVIIVALRLVSVARTPKPPAQTTQQIWNQSGVPVGTASAILGSMQETVPITGDLSALNSGVISPKISGRLMSITVHEGDRVAQG